MMANVAFITLLFGCSPALAALLAPLAPPKALRTREEWRRIKSADDVLNALGWSDVTLARTVKLSDGCLRACAPVSAGEEILTWNGILSAEDAYKDMDVGLPLRKLADQCGPGFETIALSGLLGAEYLRAFRTRKPEALLEGGGAEAFTDLIESRWHELAQEIWADEARNEPVDPEVQQLVDMGVDLLIPVFEMTMRRVWTAGYESKTRGELSDIAQASIALVLRHQEQPFETQGGDVSDPSSAAWGGLEGAPTGPALLPHLHKLRGAAGSTNAALFVPHRTRGAATHALCVAKRDIAAGEAIFAA